MSHRWTGVGDHTLTGGTGSTGGSSERLRVIRGMCLRLISGDVIGHIRGTVWWEHRTVHLAHVLVT